MTAKASIDGVAIYYSEAKQSWLCVDNGALFQPTDKLPRPIYLKEDLDAPPFLSDLNACELTTVAACVAASSQNNPLGPLAVDLLDKLKKAAKEKVHDESNQGEEEDGAKDSDLRSGRNREE